MTAASTNHGSLAAAQPSADQAGTLIFTGLPTFIKAPWVACDTEALRAVGARAAFLGMPFDQATALRAGESYGPKGLRSVSEQYLPYLGEFDVDLFETFNLVDAGDVPVIPANAERSRQAIQDHVGRILDAGALPLLCGGDHSCPIPASRALTERASGRIGYLHIDAHLDAAPDLQGERYTNWSTVTRVIEDDRVDPRNMALVGIRGALNPASQWEFVKENGIGVWSMRTILARGIDAVMAEALERVTDGTEGFYVTFDLDAVDCSATPGTNGPEPGGLTPREALRVAELVGAAGPSIFDVSEYLPYADPEGITGRLACYLFFHVLGGLATRGELPQR